MPINFVMKNIETQIVRPVSYVLVLACVVFCGSSFAADEADMKYLGSKPPKDVPRRLAPDFFAQYDEGGRFGVTFTADGLECFYAFSFRGGEEIRYTSYQEGGWTDPVRMVGGKEYRAVDPHFSKDQNRVYFIATLPVEGVEPIERAPFDIWYMDREAKGWSDPIHLDGPIASEGAMEFYVSLTSDETIYFGSDRAGGRNMDLYSARLGEDGVYETPLPLSGGVNTPDYEADVFVARDESYVIFCSSGPRRDEAGQGEGRGDLYISFRNEDGSWPPAVNMGDKINTGSHEFAPSVSRDGRYFFFSRGGKLFWVDASVIEELREAKKVVE